MVAMGQHSNKKKKSNYKNSLGSIPMIRVFSFLYIVLQEKVFKKQQLEGQQEEFPPAV